jgi:hypothetical protein
MTGGGRGWCNPLSPFYAAGGLPYGRMPIGYTLPGFGAVGQATPALPRNAFVMGGMPAPLGTGMLAYAGYGREFRGRMRGGGWGRGRHGRGGW